MLLSIIIPVFKTDFVLLDRCLQSLAVQSGVNWDDVEITLVNDDDDDKYMCKCITRLKFKNTDFNFRVIQTPKHIGAGLARQYGIDRCSGEWVYFMDSDDELMSAVSLCYIIESIKAYPEKKMFTFTHMNEDRNNVVTGYNMASLYGACFKKSVLDQFDIRFIPTVLYEDIAFVNSYVYLVGWNAIQNCAAFPIYWYHLNNNSVTHGVSEAKHAELALTCDLQCVLYVNYKMYEFDRVDNSFYVYSLFRLMNETERVLQYNIKLNNCVLILYTDIILKIRHMIKTFSLECLSSVASEFGTDGLHLLDHINAFLYKNPLLGDISNAS